MSEQVCAKCGGPKPKMAKICFACWKGEIGTGVTGKAEAVVPREVVGQIVRTGVGQYELSDLPTREAPADGSDLAELLLYVEPKDRPAFERGYLAGWAARGEGANHDY